MRIVVAALALVCAMGGTAAAQWLSVPVRGTPRTPDGKPDLKAPTPRAPDGTPNLSSIWRVESYRWVNNLLPEGQEAPFRPWAKALYKKRVATLGCDVQRSIAPDIEARYTPSAASATEGGVLSHDQHSGTFGYFAHGEANIRKMRAQVSKEAA